MENEYDTTVSKLYDEYQLSRSDAEALNIKLDNIGEAQRTLSSVKAKIRSLGAVNVAAIEEYKEVKNCYDFCKKLDNTTRSVV